MGVAAFGIVDLKAHAGQLVAEFPHLRFGGVLFQDDDHMEVLLSLYLCFS